MRSGRRAAAGPSRHNKPPGRGFRGRFELGQSRKIARLFNQAARFHAGPRRFGRTAGGMGPRVAFIFISRNQNMSASEVKEAAEPEEREAAMPRTNRKLALTESEMDAMSESAREASEFLKALAHESRLHILCKLADGEKHVGELEEALDIRQSTVSQQLARLRLEGIVNFRREGKQVFYSLADDNVRKIIRVLADIFCPR